MSCENRILKNITSTCDNAVVAGIEQKLWLFNRTDIASITYDSEQTNKVTGITLKTGATAYSATGLKRNMGVSFSRNVNAEGLDTFTDTVSITGFEFDSASALNFDNMSDIVVVADRKGKKQGDGSLIILGLENGLYCSSDQYNAWENGGTRQLEFSSMDDAGESQSYYVYAVQTGSPAVDDYEASVAALDAMLS